MQLGGKISLYGWRHAVHGEESESEAATAEHVAQVLREKMSGTFHVTLVNGNERGHIVDLQLECLSGHCIRGSTLVLRADSDDDGSADDCLFSLVVRSPYSLLLNTPLVAGTALQLHQPTSTTASNVDLRPAQDVQLPAVRTQVSD